MATQDKRLGERWGVYGTYTTTYTEDPDRPGWRIARPKLDHYGVARDGTQEECGRSFTCREEAQAFADAKNLTEAEGTLDPDFADRRKALQRLGDTFWVRYGDGPRAFRWPERPGRFAVQSYSERYCETFWDTCESMEEVEREIRLGDVLQVVDLDADREIPFRVDVSVEFS